MDNLLITESSWEIVESDQNVLRDVLPRGKEDLT